MSQLSRCKLTRVRKTVEETVWKDELTTICRSEDLTVPPLVGCCRWNPVKLVFDPIVSMCTYLDLKHCLFFSITNMIPKRASSDVKRQRKRLQRIKADPVKHELYLKKQRETYQEPKECGALKTIDQLSAREQ